MIIAPGSDFAQKRASPVGAMRLLFGVPTIDVMPVDRTELCNLAQNNRPGAARPIRAGICGIWSVCLFAT